MQKSKINYYFFLINLIMICGIYIDIDRFNFLLLFFIIATFIPFFIILIGRLVVIGDIISSEHSDFYKNEFNKRGFQSLFYIKDKRIYNNFDLMKHVSLFKNTLFLIITSFIFIIIYALIVIYISNNGRF